MRLREISSLGLEELRRMEIGLEERFENFKKGSDYGDSEATGNIALVVLH